ncbi:hypothetical protein SMICM17S_11884 [Streptomyces microflavus]
MAARRTAAAGSGEDGKSLPLDELMPWSVRPLRTGRSWVMGPDPTALRARWERLAAAEGAEQERLFRPSRSRTPDTPVAALPGRSTGTGRFAREPGACPDPVRILHGPFDEQWLLPDHRLIDAARPELWRVGDERQLFTVEHGYVPQATGPTLSVTHLLPDGHSPAGRAGRIRPLYRRPDATDPNLAPGLLDVLRARLGPEVRGPLLPITPPGGAAPSTAAVPALGDDTDVLLRPWGSRPSRHRCCARDRGDRRAVPLPSGGPAQWSMWRSVSGGCRRASAAVAAAGRRATHGRSCSGGCARHHARSARASAASLPPTRAAGRQGRRAPRDGGRGAYWSHRSRM